MYQDYVDELQAKHREEIKMLEDSLTVARDTSDHFQTQNVEARDQVKALEEALRVLQDRFDESEADYYIMKDELYQAEKRCERMSTNCKLEVEFHSEIYATNRSSRFHLYEDCASLPHRARPVTMTVCPTCKTRRHSDLREQEDLEDMTG